MDACPKPRRERGSCFQCGKTDHQVRDCPLKSSAAADSTIMVIEGPKICKQTPQTESSLKKVSMCQLETKATFYEVDLLLKYNCDDLVNTITVRAMLDTGSPISIIKSKYLPSFTVNNDCVLHQKYYGINGSTLNILGIFDGPVMINNLDISIIFHVVSDDTMSQPAIIGRDFTSLENFQITLGRNVVVEYIPNGKSSEFPAESLNLDEALDNFEQELLLIDYDVNLGDSLKINPNLPSDVIHTVETQFLNEYLQAPRPERPNVDFEMRICLKNDQPVSCRPRKLSYSEKLELQQIIDNLLSEGIIRESESPYCSPIVIINKKNGQKRLCVDYREINKLTIKDNYPIRLIDDQLDLLKNKTYFTSLDLKNSFHQVSVAKDSIKYTSFICPFGQYEYLKMPFGLTNSPAVFMRLINHIFKDLIRNNKVLIYLDDILIATCDIETHLQILSEVYTLLTQNLLELRIDKCSFLQNEILYLGYIVNFEGIKPNP